MNQYNIINVNVSFDTLQAAITGCQLAPRLVSGDYNSTKMVFTFDRDYGTKTLEIKNKISGNIVFVGEIVNNEVILCGEEDGTIYSLFNTAGDYICEVSLYGEDSKLTALSFVLPVAQEQIVIGDEVIEPYMPLFDTLMQQISEAITETNNLNIQAEKVDTTTTITITHKDGSEQEVQILDGEKGETGPQGPAGQIKFLVVQTLPTENIDTSAIYLLPILDPETGNNYDEYIYVNNTWEKLGGIQVQVDLTDYVKFTDYASSSKTGVIKTNVDVGTGMNNGKLIANVLTYASYMQYLSNYGFVGKGTLENVITGKGLVSNTDYANNNVAGVIRTNTSAATYTYEGQLFCDNVNYQTYSTRGAAMFISKGTLENVITGKDLTTKAYVDGLVGDINSVLDAINGEVI